ncbi:uncharacterized protein LOC110839721 isoform X2 [Zootermopsis nevadensis]|uniref:uncharacterized protein LOC110839721 isoform X2 n=1 Tax=Zootermopsis nevadensis TaxID=136037 RepID=UPI000B8E318B|nr:uncharacterized protein LOC110839721 isoform X2 [Zootermopsis nevadensis]
MKPVAKFVQGDKPNGSMHNEFRRPTWNWDEDDDDDDIITTPPNGSFGYNIFGNPTEIHRHFEHHMQEFEHQLEAVFESFDSLFGGSFFQSHPPISQPDHYQGKQNLRDSYLKPKYWHNTHKSESIPESTRTERQLDDDLDDRVSAGQLDQILKDKPSIEKHEPCVQTHIFGNSSFSTIITNSDGTVEHHCIVRDSKGNEEVTVTKQIGDKKYSVTTHTDSTGEKQQIENFVNVEKDDLDAFKKKWSKLHQNPQEPKLADLSIFDQFFK